MGVSYDNGTWRAEARLGNGKAYLGGFDTEEAARLALASEYESIRNGTSLHLKKNKGITLKQYSEQIGVKYGTVKRWATEGMPMLRRGGSVRVDPEPANEWVTLNRSASVAFARAPRVYLVQRDSDGAIKIGFCSDVVRRVRELRKGVEYEVSLLAVFPGDKPDELRLHARFRDFRIDGEWFRPEPQLLDFIDSLRRVAA